MSIGNHIISVRNGIRQTSAFASKAAGRLRLAMALTLLACSSESITEGGSGGWPSPAPAPVVSALVPASVVEGTQNDLTLTVRGQGFVSRSRIGFGGTERQTQFVSATELRTVLTAQNIASAGVVQVTVSTAAPGGGAAAKGFTIVPAGGQAPAPAIHELAPAGITAGWRGSFTLTVKGANFTTASRILWNGTAKETHHISASELRATIDVQDVRLPGQMTVSVETPGSALVERIFPVSLRTPARVDVSSSVGGWLWVADTMTLEAVARDLAGNAIPNWTFEWSSVKDELVTVNANGRITGVAKGRTQIRATAGEVTGLAEVAVHEAPAFDLVYDVGTHDQRRIVRWTPGSGRNPITITSAGISFDPSPSPDGDRIAFTGIVDDNRDIYTIDRNGAGLWRLTTGEAADDEAAWSPDGSRIAFRSTRSGVSEIWVMNANGSDPRRLTGPVEGWSFGEESFEPAWSPDSRFIVYAKREANDADIWIMNADGSGKRRLTSGTAQDSDPVWSANGEYVTFRRAEGAHVIFVSVSAANGMTRGDLVQPTYGRAPSYSPDGKWMAYTQTGAEPASPLMVEPVDVGDWPRIVRGSAVGGGHNPQWIRRR